MSSLSFHHVTRKRNDELSCVLAAACSCARYLQTAVGAHIEVIASNHQCTLVSKKAARPILHLSRSLQVCPCHQGIYSILLRLLHLPASWSTTSRAPRRSCIESAGSIQSSWELYILNRISQIQRMQHTALLEARTYKISNLNLELGHVRVGDVAGY